MRKFLFSLPAVTLLFVVVNVAWLAKPSEAQQPVVVELFTSEGCSSCPPADAMLTKLSHQRDTNIAKLILLEEHVEYWNNAGWTDRFSAPTYTQRQIRLRERSPSGDRIYPANCRRRTYPGFWQQSSCCSSS